MIEQTPTIEAPKESQKAPKTDEEIRAQENRIAHKLVGQALKGHHNKLSTRNYDLDGVGYANEKPGPTPGTKEISYVETNGHGAAKISKIIVNRESGVTESGTNTYIGEEGEWAEVHEVGPNGNSPASAETTDEVWRGIPAQLSELRGSLTAKDIAKEIEAAKHPDAYQPALPDTFIHQFGTPRKPKGLSPEDQALAEKLRQEDTRARTDPSKLHRAIRKITGSDPAGNHYRENSWDYQDQAKKDAKAEGVDVNR